LKLTCEIGSQRAELGQSNGTQLMPRYSLPQWAGETREIGENGCENICSGTCKSRQFSESDLGKPDCSFKSRQYYRLKTALIWHYRLVHRT
jgi:hypothetical protein